MQNFTLKGQTFTSQYTNDQAILKLQYYVNQAKLTGEFPRSLARNSNRLTINQIPWVHKLVHDVENPPVKPVTAPVFLSIVQHITKAKEHLQFPMIGVEQNGVRVVMKLCGARSKHCGKVSVASSHKFGQGQFYGYINVDGTHGIGNSDVVALLLHIATNPAKVISDLGKQSGHCCYCFAELTTVQSKIAGCGDTCACNYSVDYPNAAATREYLKDHPEVLVGASDAERWS